MPDRHTIEVLTALKASNPQTAGPFQLEDFVGHHYTFQAIDTSIKIPIPYDSYSGYAGDDDVNAIIFVLDNTAYIATEDPSDGYRSTLDSIELYTKPLSSTTLLLPDIPVICRKQLNNDVIEFLEDTHLWLEIGTDRSDDYYPRYVADFWPRSA